MKYLLSSKKYGSLASFEYNEAELLQELKIEGELEPEQIKFLASNCACISDLKELLKAIQSKDRSATLEEFFGDLSFDRFWDAYDYKKGKKPQVKRKWESMSEAEQYKAIKYIKKYNFFLAERTHMERKYPLTYLNQAEWNN